MDFSEWKEACLKEIIEFNPRETIKKGTVAKKIGMDKLSTFQRKIEGYELASFSGGTKFRNGDTLLARITPCLENGKTAQVTILEKDEVAFGSTEYIVLRKKKGKSINDFIYYLAISPKLRDIAIKSMTGTTGRQRAQNDLIENTIIRVPPLNEQKAIAHILSTLDEKIEVNNQINKTLENMAQAIFKQWFVDFEFPNEVGEPYKSSGGEMVESELGMIPKGWNTIPLFDIANYINGTSFNKTEVSEFEGIPIIKIAELKQGVTDSTKCFSGNKLEKFYIKNGDVLFSWSGNPETSIDTFIWYRGIGILNQHIFKIEPYKYSKEFVFLVLKHFKLDFMQIASNKQTTGLGHVTISDLKRLKIALPDEQNIDCFSELIKPIINRMHINDLENNKLISMRDILLPKLMSGEIRVPLDSEGEAS